VLRIFSILDKTLASVERWLLIGLTLILTCIMCAQVLFRYFLNQPIFWAEEVALQILIIIAFVGVSYLAYLGNLVRVDVVLQLINKPSHVLLSRFLHLISLTIALLLSYVGTYWVLRPEVGTDISATTQIPLWYNYVILVCSFYCLSFHQLIKVIQPESSQQQNADQLEDEPC